MPDCFVPRPAGRAGGTAATDIIELMLSDHRRIRRQGQALRDMAGRQTGSGPGGALAGLWDTLAGLIELHLCAEQEICWLPMCGTSPRGREQIAAAAAAAADITEAIGAARLQPAGSPAWWRAVNDALSFRLDHAPAGPVRSVPKLSVPERVARDPPAAVLAAWISAQA